MKGLIGCFFIPAIIICLFSLILFVGILGQNQSTLTALPGANGSAIAENALLMVPHLHPGPPDNYDVLYDAQFPQAAIAFWQQTCPNCGTWRNGNLQCGMFVSAAYGLAGLHLQMVDRVIQWWDVYQHVPGWTRIPDGSGLPAPGDILILDTGQISINGHAAIVTHVQPALAGQPGSITIAQANALEPLTMLSLDQHNHLAIWPGYTVKGYLRYTHFIPTVPGHLPNSPYVAIAQQDAIAVGISPYYFIAQINQESGFNPLATSPAGAQGIAQIMPATAAAWKVNPWDPSAALMAAAEHMAQYNNDYHDYAKALAAYNAGPGMVNYAIAHAQAIYGTSTRWLDCMPKETQDYVRRILNS